jgi:cobalt-zinc-cadmium efflux system outer membrane protein
VTLAELERLALQNNPTMTAARAAVEAARARARQAGARPNPVIGYTAEEVGIARSLGTRGAHGLFVEQAILMGGKLQLTADVFDRSADEAQIRVDLQERRIVSTVRTLFYQLLMAERRIEVHQRLAALGSETAGVTAQLFNVGAADRPDFLVSEIESRRVQLGLDAARNQIAALRLQLAAATGRPETAIGPLSGSIDAAIPELERDATLQALIETSPQVRAARAAVTRAQAATALARRARSPDLFLRGAALYNRKPAVDGQPVGWEGQIEAGLSIPFSGNESGVAAARAEETVAQAEVTRLQLWLRAQAAGEFADYLTALAAAETYRADIIPRAEQAYTLYLSRYREMAVAYPQVLVSQRTLFELSREYLVHLDTAWRSALRLQGLLAGDGLDMPGPAESGASVSLRMD